MAVTTSTDPLRGVKLGEYVVEERIGIGGMGYVYRAVHPLIGNQVAIKVLRPDIISTETDLQRFLGEAKAINQVRHRGVVSIFGAGDTPDGRKYLVMELLQGESLEALLQREGRIPTEEAVPILEETLAALTAVHAAGVVHRDLKPANVFLAAQSDGRRYVKLLDFGLARRTNNLEVSRVAGTPDYISPEHAKGRPPGPPADLYAFGVMAFQLLTGKLPFRGVTAAELMKQHVSAPIPNATAYDPNIPPAMSTLIMRLMAKDPAARPEAAAVRADLEEATRELNSARTQAGGPSLRAREAKTAPGPVITPSVTPAIGSKDTEPSLQRAGSGETPVSHTPVGATPVSAPALGGDTARELPRRRWQIFALAAMGLLLFAIALNQVMSVRSYDSETGDPLPEGKRPVPTLRPLEPETGEEPPPEGPVAEEPVVPDWRAELTERLERVQRLAHEKKASGSESAAKKALARLQTATDDEQAELEQQTRAVEQRLAEGKR